MQAHTQDFLTTLKESILILIFEFLGTLLLTSLYNSSFQSADGTGFFVGFFILLIFSARISGSHFNPAVTLAFMLRKDTGRFSRKLGICYIIFQYGGALLGALISYNLFKANAQQPLSVGYSPEGTLLWFQAMIMEIVGSCLLVFLYLTQTEEKTKLSEGDPAITTLIISAAYYAVLSYATTVDTVSGSPLNPAAALGLFWAILFQGDVGDTNGIYIFFAMAYVGGLLAVVLFEFVYKKAMTIVQEEEGDDEPIHEEEQNLMQNDGYGAD